MQLKFSARSRSAPLKTFAWGAITDFDNPKNEKPVQFIADGKSHKYAIDFPVKGHLAKLTFDFGTAQGESEFDWIRLYRGGQLEKEWRFDIAGPPRC